LDEIDGQEAAMVRDGDDDRMAEVRKRMLAGGAWGLKQKPRRGLAGRGKSGIDMRRARRRAGMR
jgi:hypothetical protein